MQDDLCKRLVERHPNLGVPWWLMAQYAYRHEASPIISGGCFDWLCAFLADRWESIDHYHKSLITYFDLTTGSDLGIAFANDYPIIVVGAVRSMRLMR